MTLFVFPGQTQLPQRFILLCGQKVSADKANIQTSTALEDTILHKKKRRLITSNIDTLTHMKLICEMILYTHEALQEQSLGFYSFSQ